MNQDRYLVSIIIVNYKEYGFLRGCLASLESSNYNNTEIIVVDNEANEFSLKEIRKDFENVKLFALKENLNYAEGNNFGIVHSTGEFVVILNNDTLVDKNWLDPLIDAASSNPNAFYQPKILSLEKPDTVSSFGNAVHLFGFAFPIGTDRNATEMMMSTETLLRIFYCAGACIFTSRKVLDKLGGFDSNYWTYFEDVNLGWKGNLYGYPSYVVTSSTIYHKWGASHGQELSPKKFFLLERGRLSTLLRNFSLRSILIVSPFILIVDIILIFYLLPKKGMTKAKVKASLDVLRNWRIIYNERKTIQTSRIINDKDISVLFSNYIQHPYITIPTIAKELSALISKKLKTLL
jgi:GT2 family glycosyltransferase